MKTKKLNKKILAVLMTVMMCMSGFQVAVFADMPADASDSVTNEAASTDSGSSDTGSESSSASGTNGGADIVGDGTGIGSGTQAVSSASDTGTVSNDTAAGNSQTAVSGQNSFVSSGNDIVIVDGNVTINNNTPESNDESSEEGADSEVEGGSQEVDNNLGSGSGTDEESGNTDADSSASSEDGTNVESGNQAADNNAGSENGAGEEGGNTGADSNVGSENETNAESGNQAADNNAGFGNVTGSGTEGGNIITDSDQINVDVTTEPAIKEETSKSENPAGSGSGNVLKDPEKVEEPDKEKPEEEKPEEKPDLETDESARLQAFIDAAAQLPETVTEENYEAVEAMLQNLNVIFGELTEEQQDSDEIMAVYMQMVNLLEQLTGVKAELLVETGAAKIGETPYETLAKAIDAADANANAIITLTKDVAESITIGKSVTIDLGGFTWSANGATTLTTQADVTLKNGTITSTGGTKNSYVIYAKSGSLTLDGITVTGHSGNNPAVLTSSSYGSKYLVSSVTILGGAISDNKATNADAVLNIDSKEFTMTGTQITNNEGVQVIRATSPTVTLIDVTASGNTSTASGMTSSGGGVLNYSPYGNPTLTMTNVKAYGNTAKGYGGVLLLSTANATGTLMATLDSCEFSGNTADLQGGAISVASGTKSLNLEIRDTLIHDNTSNFNTTPSTSNKAVGGGLYVGATKPSYVVTLTGETHIYNNHTPNEKGGYSADIGLASDYVKKTSKWYKPTLSEYTGKHATLNMDESVETITASDGFTYTLTKLVDSDKTQLMLYQNGTRTEPYRWYWPIGYFSNVTVPKSVYLNGEHGASDSVAVYRDLAQAVEDAKSGAGIVYVCESVALTADNVDLLNKSGVTFARCKEHPNGYMFTVSGEVTLNGAHIDGQNVASDSALIHVTSGHLTIGDGTVIENGRNGSTNGGGIRIDGGTLTMTGGRISNNTLNQGQSNGVTTYGNGGGIYARGSAVMYFDGGEISGNTAGCGGGVFIQSEYAESYFGTQGGRTTFSGNYANSQGGGVAFYGGDHQIEMATFTGNEADYAGYYYAGGAMYIHSSTTVHMKNVFLSNNKSSKAGTAECGALACCPTGDTVIYELNGLLAANNGEQPDIVVSSTTTNPIHSGMPKPTPLVYISDKTPYTGSPIGYTFFYDQDRTADAADYQYVKLSSLALKSSVDDAVVQTVKANAETSGVVITENRAYQFGAGIMNNGTLIIGTESKAVRVIKKWDDNKNHNDDQVLVYLTLDGEPVTSDIRPKDASVVLSEANNWSYIWTDLGADLNWGFVEAAVPGYSFELSEEKLNEHPFDDVFNFQAGKFYDRTLTNKPNPDKITNKLVISKKAYGLDDGESYKFTVKLDNIGDGAYAIQLPDGTLAPIYNNEITFYLKDTQSAVIDGLPNGFTYKVEEEKGDYLAYKYESITANEVGDGNIVSVDYANIAKTNITVKKLWNDEGFGYTGIRPKSITIKLMNGELEEGEATITADKNGDWIYTFTDLPKYDAEGNEIQYTVVEVIDDNSHYKPNYNGGNAGWEITNNLKSGSLIIRKEVKGDVDSEKEYKFTITGPHNYKVEKTVKGVGNIEITNLVPGEYTVTEQDADIDGYKWTVEGNGVTVNVVEDTVNGENAEQAEESKKAEVTITNTYQKLGELTIQKAVNIDADGEAEALAKTYTFKVTGPNGYDKTVTITGRGSATLEKLEPGTYTVTEIQDGVDINIAGYNLTVSGEGNVEVEYDKTSDITITNNYDKPKEPENPCPDPSTGSLTIVKTVQGVTGDLLLNHEFRFTVTGPNDYSKSVTASVNKPALIEGLAPGTYTVTEDSDSAAISGYRWNVTVSGEGVTANGASASVTVNAGEDAKAAVTFTNTYRRPPSDPDDPTPPTPTTPENPPTTPEEPRTDVPDPDVPLVNIPEEPPVTDIPEEEPPLTNIPEEEPPLVDIPEEEPPLSEIPEEEPPLAEMPPVEILDGDVPKTGDTNSALLWLLMSLMALFGMGTVLTESCVRRRRK